MLINVEGDRVDVSPTSDDWAARSNDILVNVPMARSVKVDAAGGRMINLLVGNPDSHVSVEGELYRGRMLTLGELELNGTRLEAGRLTASHLPECRPADLADAGRAVDDRASDRLAVDLVDRARPVEAGVDDHVVLVDDDDDRRRHRAARRAGGARRGVQPRRRGDVDAVVDRAAGEPARAVAAHVELAHPGADGEPSGGADPPARASRATSPSRTAGHSALMIE